MELLDFLCTVQYIRGIVDLFRGVSMAMYTEGRVVHQDLSAGIDDPPLQKEPILTFY